MFSGHHVAGAAGLVALVAGAWGPRTAGAPQASTGTMEEERGRTAVPLMRPVRAEFRGQRLEEVLRFIAESSGTTIETLWADGNHAAGLDPDLAITLKSGGIPALRVIEAVLAFAGQENTWQMSANGACQVGPRSRLNQFRRVEVYDVGDLVVEVPDYTELPVIDLQAVLQGRGGGSRSPLRSEPGERENEASPDRDTRALQLMRLITDLIEPEQWTDAGGTAASATPWQGTLIVHAPGYIHRQIGGRLDPRVER